MGGGAGTEPCWDGSAIPSQKDKLAIVTGANSGIGFEAAKALAAHGAQVILACRDKNRGQHAEQIIRKELSKVPGDAVGSVKFMQVDMGDPTSVHTFARAFKAKFDHLDLLINNAGVFVPSRRYMPNGPEVHFAVNHLGHFYLTSLLWDLLRNSKDQARVVNVGSIFHYMAWLCLNFDKLGNPRSTLQDYATSKLAILLFTYELQRRLEAAQVDNVVAVAAHPGVTYSGVWSRYFHSILPGWLAPIPTWLTSWLPCMSTQMGVLSILYAATMRDVQGGQFYGPDGFLRLRGYPAMEEGAASSHSLENASKLWTLSEELLGDQFEV